MFYYIILFYFNPPKSVGGMEGEGQKYLTETLNSLEGAGGMEEENYVLYIILFYFNSPKSDGGMEGEGQIKFNRDSNFSGGSWRNGGRQVCFITLYCFIPILQNLLEE